MGRKKNSQSKCSHCVGSHPTDKLFKQQQNQKGYKKPPFNPLNSNNKYNEHNGPKPNTCFRCGLEDHFIVKFSKPETSDRRFYWNTEKPKLLEYRSRKRDKTSETVYMKVSINRYMCI